MTSLPTRLSAEDWWVPGNMLSALPERKHVRVVFASQYDALRAHVASLEADLAACRRDAERYRYLRDNEHMDDDGDGWLCFSFDCTGPMAYGVRYRSMTQSERGAALDTAIDAALSAQAKAAEPPCDSAGTGATAHKRAERCPHGVSELNRCERCD